MIGGRMQIENEGAWEQVGPTGRMLDVWVNEDVGERRRGVTNISPLFELQEKRANQPVDGRRVTLLRILTRLGQSAGIHGGVVRLIVYHENRCIAGPVVEPVTEVLKDGLVLLYHEHSGRTAQLVNPEPLGHGLAEVPGRLAAGQRKDGQILELGLREEPDANLLAIIIVC